MSKKTRTKFFKLISAHLTKQISFCLIMSTKNVKLGCHHYQIFLHIGKTFFLQMLTNLSEV